MTSRTFAKPMSAMDARFEAQKLAFAPVVFQCVRVARKWGLLASIDQAADGCTVAELSARHHRSDYAISVLLETCLSCGVVSLSEHRYRLDKIGQFVLRDEMTRVNFNFTQEICYLGMYDLETALIEGRPAGLQRLGPWDTIYPGLKDLSEEARRAWFEFDHQYSDSAYAEALPMVFASKPKRLMDIGANTGKWARRCLDFDPEVRLTLLDLPGQLRAARANLAGEGERLDFCEIDVLDASRGFPAGHDVVWMSQFLSCFGKSSVLSIFQRARASLGQGGRVQVLETCWDRQRYDIAAYCVINTSPYFSALANGVSKMHRSDEYIELAAEAGLRLTDIRDGIGLSHSLFTFVRA